MVDDDDKSGSSRAEAVRAKGGLPHERPFDRWLQKQLHAMYDEITNEPVPQDLLDLIDRDAAKASGKTGRNDK